MALPIVDQIGSFSSSSGLTSDKTWAYLYTINQKTGDYDLLWIYFPKLSFAPGVNGYLAFRRGSNTQGQYVNLPRPPATILDLSCGTSRLDNPYSFSIVCGPSVMQFTVGLPKSKSPYLTAVYYEDKRQPTTKATENAAPGVAHQIGHLIQTTFGVSPLV